MAMVTIEEATASDIPAIEALLRATRMISDGVQEHIADFVVAREGQEIVGVGTLEACSGQIGLLRSVAVVPAYRGRHIAGDICAHLLSRAKLAGIGEVYLLTITAQGYFARLGFTSVARAMAPDGIRGSRQFRDLCPESAVLMHRPLHA